MRIILAALMALVLSVAPASAADVLLKWLKGETPIETINGVPFPGAKIYIYDPGTTSKPHDLSG